MNSKSKLLQYGMKKKHELDHLYSFNVKLKVEIILNINKSNMLHTYLCEYYNFHTKRDSRYDHQAMISKRCNIIVKVSIYGSILFLLNCYSICEFNVKFKWKSEIRSSVHGLWNTIIGELFIAAL